MQHFWANLVQWIHFSWKICVSQDFLDPIKTVYLRGLHIAHLETTYLEALLYMVLFLGFRVDFFPFMHDIQNCTSLNQPGIIRNFSQKKNFLAPNECWHFIFAVFFSLTSESRSTQSLHPRIIHYLELINHFGKFSSIRN